VVASLWALAGMSEAVATPVPAGRDRRVPLNEWLQTLSGVLGVLVLLELVVRVGIIPERYFPAMTTTFGALFEQFGEPGYWQAILDTLQGWGIGLAIATAIAVPLGLLIGFNELIYHATRPIVEFLRPVPSVALIPLAILVYGSGQASKIFLVVFASTWPLLIQTIYGAHDIDPIQLETARSYRVRRRDRLLRVTLPSAIPYIATGLRIASAVALILAVTAELIIGSPGLGRSINLARSGGAVDLMYALIITTGLLGWLLNSLFARAEARVLHWHPSHREAAS
jgi:ABC-type nitrate/sulfonate/bicarbonate transport system permease component